MGCDKARQGDAVAICEQSMLLANAGDDLVVNAGFAEAVIRLPDVMNRNREVLPELIDQYFGFICRAIIGNIDDKAGITLLAIPFQRQTKKVRSVVG